MADTTSTGTDGWRSKELKLLPPSLLQPFADMMDKIENGAPWPKPLLYAITAMLGKKNQDPLKAGSLKQRPVTVASVLYRAYSSIRYRDLCPWMQHWIHPNFRGGVPEGECKDLTLDMGLDIEAAAVDGEALWGLDEDIKKYYDMLVREIIFAAARELGAPQGFLDSQARFYTGLLRAFKYERHIGNFFSTQTSVLQGCALSQIWANIDGSCWAWVVEAASRVKVGGYIDDKSLRHRDRDEVQAAARNDCIEKMPALPKTNLSAGFTLHGRKPPWRGTPKGINWPELQVTYDPALVARLHSDAAVSRARRLCSGHGIWTAPLRFGASKSAPPECICLPGHSGPDCGTPPLMLRTTGTLAKICVGLTRMSGGGCVGA